MKALLLGVIMLLSVINVADAAPCPRSLGCGCNLATYFQILDAKLKRQLWLARAWLDRFPAAQKGCIGCVAVTTRRGGGHVGVVKNYDANGNPVIYSWGNARIGWHTQTYSARSVLGYRNVTR